MDYIDKYLPTVGTHFPESAKEWDILAGRTYVMTIRNNTLKAEVDLIWKWNNIKLKNRLKDVHKKTPLNIDQIGDYANVFLNDYNNFIVPRSIANSWCNWLLSRDSQNSLKDMFETNVLSTMNKLDEIVRVIQELDSKLSLVIDFLKDLARSSRIELKPEDDDWALPTQVRLDLNYNRALLAKDKDLVKLIEFDFPNYITDNLLVNTKAILKIDFEEMRDKISKVTYEPGKKNNGEVLKSLLQMDSTINNPGLITLLDKIKTAAGSKDYSRYSQTISDNIDLITKVGSYSSSLKPAFETLKTCFDSIDKLPNDINNLKSITDDLDSVNNNFVLLTNAVMYGQICQKTLESTVSDINNAYYCAVSNISTTLRNGRR